MTSIIDIAREKIKNSIAKPLVSAETFIQRWQSYSKPVLFICSDGNKYVIKGSHNGRNLVSEHIVGRCGQFLKAPVGEVSLAVIPETLIAIEPNLSDIGSGVGSATLYVEGSGDRETIAYINEPENRSRFAKLMVLYSWVLANDHQLIYSTTQPHLVNSVDHGHFLYGSTGWSIDTLNQIGPVALDVFFQSVGLTNDEIIEARRNLEEISEEDILFITQCPPDSWGITPDDRKALKNYLVTRRNQLLALLPE